MELPSILSKRSAEESSLGSISPGRNVLARQENGSSPLAVAVSGENRASSEIASPVSGDTSPLNSGVNFFKNELWWVASKSARLSSSSTISPGELPGTLAPFHVVGSSAAAESKEAQGEPEDPSFFSPLWRNGISGAQGQKLETYAPYANLLKFRPTAAEGNIPELKDIALWKTLEGLGFPPFSCAVDGESMEENWEILQKARSSISHPAFPSLLPKEETLSLFLESWKSHFGEQIAKLPRLQDPESQKRFEQYLRDCQLSLHKFDVEKRFREIFSRLAWLDQQIDLLKSAICGINNLKNPRLQLDFYNYGYLDKEANQAKAHWEEVIRKILSSSPTSFKNWGEIEDEIQLRSEAAIYFGYADRFWEEPNIHFSEGVTTLIVAPSLECAIKELEKAQPNKEIIALARKASFYGKNILLNESDESDEFFSELLPLLREQGIIPKSLEDTESLYSLREHSSWQCFEDGDRALEFYIETIEVINELIQELQKQNPSEDLVEIYRKIIYTVGLFLQGKEYSREREDLYFYLICAKKELKFAYELKNDFLPYQQLKDLAILNSQSNLISCKFLEKAIDVITEKKSEMGNESEAADAADDDSDDEDISPPDTIQLAEKYSQQCFGVGLIIKGVHFRIKNSSAPFTEFENETLNNFVTAYRAHLEVFSSKDDFSSKDEFTKILSNHELRLPSFYYRGAYSSYIVALRSTYDPVYFQLYFSSQKTDQEEPKFSDRNQKSLEAANFRVKAAEMISSCSSQEELLVKMDSIKELLSKSKEIELLYKLY